MMNAGYLRGSNKRTSMGGNTACAENYKGHVPINLSRSISTIF